MCTVALPLRFLQGCCFLPLLVQCRLLRQWPGCPLALFVLAPLPGCLPGACCPPRAVPSGASGLSGSSSCGIGSGWNFWSGSFKVCRPTSTSTIVSTLSSGHSRRCEVAALPWSTASRNSNRKCADGARLVGDRRRRCSLLQPSSLFVGARAAVLNNSVHCM